MKLAIHNIRSKYRYKYRYGPVSELFFLLRAVPYRLRAPKLPAVDQVWVDALKALGCFVTDLEQLQLPITAEFRAAVAAVLPTLPDRSSHYSDLDPLDGRNIGLHCFSLSPQQMIPRFPALVRFGLEERVLGIVEAYLGVPIALTAVSLRKDIGGGNQVGTRFWHLDTEDARVIRMMVYLNDVSLTDGPFEYIPRPATESARALRERAYRSAGDPILDDEMRAHVPESEWRPITGPAGTVLLADNAVCYHHGKVHDSERIVLIYTYTSRKPRYPRLAHNPAFDAVLNERQRACMFVSSCEPDAWGLQSSTLWPWRPTL